MQERVKTKAEPKTNKVTLEIDAELAADAADKGIDLVAVLEHALRRALNVATPLTGTECDNLKALERHVAEHGPWWDHSEKN